MPLQVELGDWASSEWSLAGRAASAGAPPPPEGTSTTTVDTGHRGLVVVLGIVALLVAAGVVLSMGSDGRGDDTTETEVPPSTLAEPTTTLPEASTTTAAPRPPMTIDVRPPPAESLPALPEFVVPRFLPLTVHLSQGAMRMATPERGARYVTVDLYTGRVVEQPGEALTAYDSLWPDGRTIHDTELGALEVVVDPVNYRRLVRPLAEPDAPGIPVGNGYVVGPRGSLWVLSPFPAELVWYPPGLGDAVVRRPVPDRTASWLVGTDGQGDPVVNAVDGRAYAARPDGTFDRVSEGQLLAVQGDMVVVTDCDRELRCTTRVRTPEWERDLGVVAHTASVSPTGDAAVVIADSATWLVASDAEVTRIQASYGAGANGWTADGAYLVLIVDPTTLVVWEVDEQGLTWVQMSSEWGINSLVGVERQTQR